MKKKLYTLLIFCFILVSCNNQSLSEEEIATINEFLSWEWYDLQVTTWDNETVPHQASYKFFLEDGKLKYDTNDFWSASFGNKHYKSEGNVVLSYIKKYKYILIELINKDGEAVKRGKIFINREDIIRGLSEQIKYREQIVDVLKNGPIALRYSGEFDQLGVFKSLVLKRRQSQDFSLVYSYFPILHRELTGEFKPYEISGFNSPGAGSRSGISWTLKEAAPRTEKNLKELDSNDLIESYKLNDLIQLLEMLQNTMKYSGSNITDQKSFESDIFFITFDPSFDWVSKVRRLNRNSESLSIPISTDSFDFLPNWYGLEGSAFAEIEIREAFRQDGKFKVYIHFKSHYETGAMKFLNVYMDKLNKNRVHFFNELKYFSLEASLGD
jgi:hypothetical protein